MQGNAELSHHGKLHTGQLIFPTNDPVVKNSLLLEWHKS